MSEVSLELVKHREAMKLARKADHELNAGKEREAQQLYLLAFQLEKSVALSMLSPDAHEPTRSVIFRSAASLGMLAGEYREAEKLVAQGLSGNPPVMIAQQLRDLFGELNVRRHLSLEGVLLGSISSRLSHQGQRSENWLKAESAPKKKSTFLLVQGREKAEQLKAALAANLSGKAIVIATDGFIDSVSMALTLLSSEEYQGSRVVLFLADEDDSKADQTIRNLLGKNSESFLLIQFGISSQNVGPKTSVSPSKTIKDRKGGNVTTSLISEESLAQIIDFIRAAEKAAY